MRFYFKALFGAATIQAWLHFEGSVYKDWHAWAYTALVISLLICIHVHHVHTFMYMHCTLYNVRVHTCMYKAVDPLPCEILRVAFIWMSWQKHAATFRGRQNFEVQRDFKEYRFAVVFLLLHTASTMTWKLLSGIVKWYGYVTCIDHEIMFGHRSISTKTMTCTYIHVHNVHCIA